MGVRREVELGVLAAGVGRAMSVSRGSMPIGGTDRATGYVEMCSSWGTAASAEDTDLLLTVIGPSRAFDSDEYVETCEGVGIVKSIGEESVVADGEW